MTTDQDTEIHALAAMTCQQGQMPQTRAGKDVLILGMIATALGAKMTWAQIGSALRWGSGREAKRKAHQLCRSVNARLRQEAIRSEVARVGGDD